MVMQVPMVMRSWVVFWGLW